jgi:Tfp pilus assembly protein FimT
MKSPSTKAQGFSLVDAMITLAVVGTLVAFAAPNMATFARSSRLRSDANNISQLISVARTEAIKRQLPRSIAGGTTPGVTVCAAPPTDGMPDAALICDAASPTDWFAFVDDNGNGQHDVAEAVIARVANTHASILTRVSNSGRITFNASGFAYPLVGANLLPVREIVVCDDKGVAPIGDGTLTEARAVRLTATGRATVSHDFAEVSAALAATGGTCP